MSQGQFLASAKVPALYHLADVNDSSGNGRTLTNNNGITFEGGKFGDCANFGSSSNNKYFSRSDNAGLVLADDYAVLGWFMVSTQPSSGANNFIYRNRLYGGRDHTVFYTNASGTYKISVYNTSSSEASAPWTATLGSWNFIEILNISDIIYVYINGVLIVSQAKSTTNASSTSLWLGGTGSSGYSIMGKMEEWVFIQATYSHRDAMLHYMNALGLLS